MRIKKNKGKNTIVTHFIVVRFLVELVKNNNHKFSAFESIEYINNSPDALNFICLHIWSNGYANNHY